MSDSRLVKGFWYAVKSGAACASGAAIMNVLGTSGNKVAEAGMMSAVGGFAAGATQDTLNTSRDVTHLRIAIAMGLSSFGLYSNEKSRWSSVFNETATDVIQNMLTTTLGFITVGVVDYLTTGSTTMTLGNALRDAAVGTIPLSLMLRCAELICEHSTKDKKGSHHPRLR
jgi:hypothetical protein